MQIEYGNKVWRNKQGQYHRTDGPAIEWENGTKIWYVNDKCHRTDGPAVEYADGTKVWWVDGKRMRAIVWTVEIHSKVPKAHYVASFEEAKVMMFSSLKEHKCSWVEKVG